MNSFFEIKGEGCLACSNQVMKKIGELQGVFGADVDFVNNVVNVQHTDEVSREEIENILGKLAFFEENKQCEL